MVASHLLPSSQSKGTQYIYSQGPFSQCYVLARDEAYSREILLQHHETPCLKKYITTHDSHTIFVFLICQVWMQLLFSPPNWAGIKTTIPPAFAYYIPTALMSKWEYNLREKLLEHCSPDSNCADLMETMSHKHCACAVLMLSISGLLSMSQTVGLAYETCAGQFHTVCTALLRKCPPCNAECFCIVLNSAY